MTDGAYFRVHLHPKRFPAAYEVQDWRARIVHDGAEFVVVNKPPGLQVWLRHREHRGEGLNRLPSGLLPATDRQ